MQMMTKILLAVATAAVLFACGSSEETFADKWADYCDASANVEAANCPADMDTSSTAMFCKFFVSSYYDTPECSQKLDALIACSPNRQWECWEGGEVPMVVEPDPCEAEAAAFVISNESPGECVDPSTITTTQGG